MVKVQAKAKAIHTKEAIDHTVEFINKYAEICREFGCFLELDPDDDEFVINIIGRPSDLNLHIMKLAHSIERSIVLAMED